MDRRGRLVALLIALAACSPTGATGPEGPEAASTGPSTGPSIDASPPTAPPSSTPAPPTTVSTPTTARPTTAPPTTARPARTTTTTTTTTSTTATTTTAPRRPLRLAGIPAGVSDSVVRLHLGLLGRRPSPAELRSGVERYRETGSLDGVTADVLASPEYRSRRPGDPPDAEFVRRLYADVLGRSPDPEGEASWLANLARGMGRAAVATWFVQSPEAVLRTGTAPPEPPPPPRGGSRAPSTRAPAPGVLALGDSVMLGAAGALGDAVAGIAVDAEVSRQFGTGIEILRALAERGELPGTVVVHLGTNGPIDQQSCDALMDVLAGSRVVLVTLHVPRSWEAGNNAVLRDCALRHGAGLADWSSIADRPGQLAGDGYHLTSTGAAAYAALVASVL